MEIEKTIVETNWGKFHLAQIGGKLCRVIFPTEQENMENWLKRNFPGYSCVSKDSNKFPFASELKQYFAGSLQEFTAPFMLSMTSFQEKTLRFVEKIPFGRVVSYGEIAEAIGYLGAARAVGSANGANPVPIRIPCQRVVAANDGLGGFGGGLHMKIALLELEGWKISNQKLRRNHREN